MRAGGGLLKSVKYSHRSSERWAASRCKDGSVLCVTLVSEIRRHDAPRDDATPSEGAVFVLLVKQGLCVGSDRALN